MQQKYSKNITAREHSKPIDLLGVRNVRGYIIHIALRFPRAGAVYAFTYAGVVV